ncbi:MAG TPA: hypothetical protein VFQ53_30535 [Kofleriaceae bacterium]|nr:hypothetical protein [Kofleriaceae bacterium]
MSLPLATVTALVCVCLSGTAWADRAIAAQVEPGAPFDAGELVAALRVRLPADGAPVRVRVTRTARGVALAANGGTRELELDDRRGADAARLAALALDDLLLDDLALAPELPLAPPSLTAHHEPRRSHVAVGVVGALAAWDGMLGGAAVDASLPAGRWLVALDAGIATNLDGPLGITTTPVRASLGRRVGPIELRAGGVVAPIVVSDGIGDRTVLAGASTSARVRGTLGGGLRLVLAIGVDAFATRTEYREAGMTVATTPRLAPWLATGIEVAR